MKRKAVLQLVFWFSIATSNTDQKWSSSFPSRKL